MRSMVDLRESEMATGAGDIDHIEPAAELRVSVEEVINCSLPVWYETFKDITIKSILVPLPQDFVDYLNSDGVILPESCEFPSFSQDDVDSDIDDDKVNWSDSDSDTDCKAPSFPELVQQISDTIKELDGAVLPKLNWSAPRDATWMSPVNSMKCTTPGEVILLLKSSDFVAHDLSRVFEYCSDKDTVPRLLNYTLCLRKWTHIPPSIEFRCFVCNNQLIGISQRYHTTCYQFLVTNRDIIRRDITQFFHQKIAGRLPNKNCVFDVYRIKEDRIRLIDFNPYSPMTDSLLFSWDELNDGAKDDLPMFRIVEGTSPIQPSDLSGYRLPKDVVDISTGEDAHKFVDLFKAKLRQSSFEEDYS